jgi:hypothetical protein
MDRPKGLVFRETLESILSIANWRSKNDRKLSLSSELLETPALWRLAEKWVNQNQKKRVAADGSAATLFSVGLCRLEAFHQPYPVSRIK